MNNLVITQVGNGFIVEPDCEPHRVNLKEKIKVCSDYKGLLELIKQHFEQKASPE